jgi:hypothetical protein
MAPTCQRCGHALEVLKQPTKRLRGTGYRWRGFVSLFTRALRNCPQCGAVYTGDGELLAAAVVETTHELSVRSYRDDMAQLRDAFAAVTIAAELGVAWMLFGPQSFGLAALLLAGAIGLLAVPPFIFFAKKVREARRDLKALRDARINGEGWRLPAAPAPTTTTGN